MACRCFLSQVAKKMRVERDAMMDSGPAGGRALPAGAAALFAWWPKLPTLQAFAGVWFNDMAVLAGITGLRELSLLPRFRDFTLSTPRFLHTREKIFHQFLPLAAPS